MWIRVALTKDALLVGSQGTISIGKGTADRVEQYYFGRDIFEKLEADGFLWESWGQFDAMYDLGDSDFFDACKCKPFAEWLKERLTRELSTELRTIYGVMLDYANKAIKADTGMYFDF